MTIHDLTIDDLGLLRTSGYCVRWNDGESRFHFWYSRTKKPHGLYRGAIHERTPRVQVSMTAHADLVAAVLAKITQDGLLEAAEKQTEQKVKEILS